MSGAITKSAECSSTSKSRFIVFIGNLPYSATTAAISAHFSAVSPCSIRLITDKIIDITGSKNSQREGRCKGFAFLEFDRYDRMQLCLENFHHSLFPDSGRLGGRKINVELTAGGGGAKSKTRKQKLLHKNDKLNVERKRRAEGQAKKKAQRNCDQVGNKDPTQREEDRHEIHPSRKSLFK